MSDFKKTAGEYLRALLRRMYGPSIRFVTGSVCFGYDNVFDAFCAAAFDVKDSDIVDTVRALGKAMQPAEDVPGGGVGRIPLFTKRVKRLWRMTTDVEVVFYNTERVDGDLAEIVFNVLRGAFSVDESEPMVLADAELRDGLLQMTLAPKDGRRLPDFAWFKKTLSSKYIPLFDGKEPNIRHLGNTVTISGKITTKGTK